MVLLISSSVESLLCLLVEGCLLLELRTSLAEHKVVGTGRKNLSSESLGIIENDVTPIPPLESWLWEKQHHTSDAHTEHIQPPGECHPGLERY